MMAEEEALADVDAGLGEAGLLEGVVAEDEAGVEFEGGGEAIVFGVEDCGDDELRVAESDGVAGVDVEAGGCVGREDDAVVVESFGERDAGLGADGGVEGIASGVDGSDGGGDGVCGVWGGDGGDGFVGNDGVVGGDDALLSGGEGFGGDEGDIGSEPCAGVVVYEGAGGGGYGLRGVEDGDSGGEEEAGGGGAEGGGAEVAQGVAAGCRNGRHADRRSLTSRSDILRGMPGILVVSLLVMVGFGAELRRNPVVNAASQRAEIGPGTVVSVHGVGLGSSFELAMGGRAGVRARR